MRAVYGPFTLQTTVLCKNAVYAAHQHTERSKPKVVYESFDPAALRLAGVFNIYKPEKTP